MVPVECVFTCGEVYHTNRKPHKRLSLGIGVNIFPCSVINLVEEGVGAIGGEYTVNIDSIVAVFGCIEFK